MVLVYIQSARRLTCNIPHLLGNYTIVSLLCRSKPQSHIYTGKEVTYNQRNFIYDEDSNNQIGIYNSVNIQVYPFIPTLIISITRPPSIATSSGSQYLKAGSNKQVNIRNSLPQ